MILNFCHNTQMIWSEFGVNNLESMNPSCLVSTVQADGGGVMVFSCHTLNPLVLSEHYISATGYLSVGVDHVHPFMTTVYSSDGYLLHKVIIISKWFVEHETEFAPLKCPPVTRSQSNRTPFGCGRMRDWHRGCADDKCLETARCYVKCSEGKRGSKPVLVMCIQ